MKKFLVTITLLLLLLTIADAIAGNLKKDETVVFFPGYAFLDAAQKNWQVTIHAWVFEEELDSITRRAALGAFRRALQLEKNAEDTKLFKQRAHWFLVDSERRKNVVVNIAGLSYPIGRTGSNGHLDNVFNIPRTNLVYDKTHNSWQEFNQTTKHGQSFSGQFQLLSSEGVSIITDIDDTIKISNVKDKQKLLTNTFLKEFTAVPAMASFYQQWHKQGASFHYVSSSPWQLYPALSEFINRARYPQGSYHLRTFDWTKSSFLDLFASPEESKRSSIKPLLKAFPKRRFILIGDSGEKDPEIYANLLREHPSQIELILIRSVDNDSSTQASFSQARFAQAFAGVPPERWQVFSDASTLNFSQLKHLVQN